MKKAKILTENPYEELWLHLSYFENYYNCYNYLENNNNIPTKEKTKERALILQYYIKQAHEYYNSSLKVSLLTKPTLLYYGTLCLSRALFLAKKGYPDDTARHGLKANKELSNLINLKAKITKKGTFLQFYRIIHSDYYPGPNDIYKTEWTLKELLSMIPEIKEIYENIFKEKSLVLKINRFFDEDKEYIKINDDFFNSLSRNDKEIFLNNIKNLKEFYLPPKFVPDSSILLHKRVVNKDDLTNKNIMGEEYLISGIKKNNNIINLPDMAIHLIILFLLSILSRYHVKEWGSGSLELESGDFYIIKNFLKISTRKFPNFVLNELTNKENVFSSELYKPTDFRIDVYKTQISELVDDIINNKEKQKRTKKLLKESKHDLWG